MEAYAELNEAGFRVSSPDGPSLDAYAGRGRRSGPPIEDDRDPVDPPRPQLEQRPEPRSVPKRNPDDVQINVRTTREHRAMLDDLVAAHPRRRATIRDVFEDLIEDAHRALDGQPHP